MREQELQPRGVTIESSKGDGVLGEPELEWSCEVLPGRTTLYDLDLRSR